MTGEREVRFRKIANGFRNGRLQFDDQPIIRLGDVGKWSMVRHAEFPQAAPFVISRKDWDKLPQSGDTPNKEGNVL